MLDAKKPTGAMSVSAWMKGESGNANAMGFMGTHGGGGSRGFGVGPNNGGTFHFRVAIDANNTTNTSVAGHDDTVWVHYVCVYEPSTRITIYRNGVQVAENAAGIPASQFTANGLPVRIGSRGDDTTFFLGQMGPVAMWGRVVALNEIRTLFGDPHAIVRQRVARRVTLLPNNPWYYYANQS